VTTTRSGSGPSRPRPTAWGPLSGPLGRPAQADEAAHEPPGLRDSALWLGLLTASGAAGCLLRGGCGRVPCFLVYGVLYRSASDSRWHETGHGMAF